VDVVERAQWLRSFFAKMSRERLGYVSCLFMLLPVTGAGWYDGDGILVGIGKIACETASAKEGARVVREALARLLSATA
jgi:hypothetical protein